MGKSQKNSRATLMSALLVPLLYYSCVENKLERSLEAPLLENIGSYHWEVTVPSRSKLVQKLFDQGMVMTYGFNHAEAARSFREAIKLDSACAMCYWGLSYVLGPNINAGMDPSVVVEARLASERANQFKAGHQPMEEALIDAIGVRYDDSLKTRAAQDNAFASKMRIAYEKFGNHPDVAVVAAESFMDLHPWDYWMKDGEPRPWTMEFLTILENTIKTTPEHPGANHLYIHAVEASTRPDRALEAAKRLEELVPASGHLLHMPSHIYLRTGRYHDGVRVNQLAALADSTYIAACRSQGIYPLIYYPHNYHFLAACATLEGSAEVAINAALKVAFNTRKELMAEPGYGTLQHYAMIPLYTMVKFAQWSHILSYPQPDTSLLYPTVVWHYATGMAEVGLGNHGEAKEHLSFISAHLADSSLLSVRIWDINDALKLTNIAHHVLAGEIALAENDVAPAIELLSDAVIIEDQLGYTEPPDWFFSTRHHLGHALLESGRYEEAEVVLKQDLEILPENGWALHGLALSLEKQGKKVESEKAFERFQRAWKYASIKLKGLKAYNTLPVAIDKRQALSPLTFSGIATCN